MECDLSKKRIIMIHGLAAKLPQNILDEYWTHSLRENIRLIDEEVAKSLDINSAVFDSAYWANATPYHIEDDTAYCKKLKAQVEKTIKESKSISDKFHVGKSEMVGAFFKDRGLDLVKLVAGILAIKDDVMKTFLTENKLYSEDQYIADQMRTPLKNTLRRAWDDGCEVSLLSHSMGTFISYDMFWRFSHRSTHGFKEYNKKRVKLFSTMGSPLGDPTIQSYCLDPTSTRVLIGRFLARKYEELVFLMLCLRVLVIIASVHYISK